MTSRDDEAEVFLNSDTIGDEFFIDIAERKFNIKRDDFKLRLALLSPATGKNENFMSVVYRAKIKVEILATKELKVCDVIIKALLALMPEMKEFNVFPREKFVYEDILRSFEKIWLDKAGEEVKFGPQSIKFESDPYEIIVLDDLKAEGFRMLDRKTGLSIEQTKVLLSKLAKFHAASAIRFQSEGVIQKYFDRKVSMPPLPEDNPMVNGVLQLYKAFCSAISGYEGCEVFADKISRWDFGLLMTQWVDVAEPIQCGFQVLNHGDLWMNNIMFKLDGNNDTTDVSLIDYQGPFWGSPTADLLYFLLSSVADEIKVDEFDNFVLFYHNELTTSLKALNYDQVIPNLADLHIDIISKSGFGCSCLLFVLFAVKNNTSEEINMEKVMTGPDDPVLMDRIYNNDNYKKAMKIWLPFMNKRGFLDSLLTQEVKIDVPVTEKNEK